MKCSRCKKKADTIYTQYYVHDVGNILKDGERVCPECVSEIMGFKAFDKTGKRYEKEVLL